MECVRIGRAAKTRSRPLLFPYGTIAQIVGPAAIGVDVIKILVEPPGQEEADYVKILVVVGSEPVRIGASVFQRIALLEGGWSAYELDGRQKPGRGHYCFLTEGSPF